MKLIERIVQSDMLTLAMCALLIAVAMFSTPGFATSRNLINVISVASPLLIIALGQMLVMISGGIDLSVTAIMALSSILGAWIVSAAAGFADQASLAIPLALIAMPLIGGLIGTVNGVNVAWLGLPPFIATLTAMMFWYGLATWWTQSANVVGLSMTFCNLGSHFGFVIPLTISIVVAIWLGLTYTRLGRWLYAVGENRDTAEVSGVPVSMVTMFVYIASGFLAGTAAIIYTAQLETGSPVLGKNLLLDIIGAVVIGGTSLFGGKGKVSWTIGGVLFIALLDNVLNLQGLSHFAVMLAKGSLILIAAFIDSIRKQGD